MVLTAQYIQVFHARISILKVLAGNSEFAILKSVNFITIFYVK